MFRFAFHTILSTQLCKFIKNFSKFFLNIIYEVTKKLKSVDHILSDKHLEFKLSIKFVIIQKLIVCKKKCNVYTMKIIHHIFIFK